jgi:hypothetical protein
MKITAQIMTLVFKESTSVSYTENEIFEKIKAELEKVGCQKRPLPKGGSPEHEDDGFDEIEPSYLSEEGAMVSIRSISSSFFDRRFWTGVGVLILFADRNVSEAIQKAIMPILEHYGWKKNIHPKDQPFFGEVHLEVRKEESFTLSEEVTWRQLTERYYHADKLITELRLNPCGVSNKIASIESLFSKLKNLKLRGDRLSGQPEILHEIQDHLRGKGGMSRASIQAILEAVPSLFSPDCDSLEKFSEEQNAFVNRLMMRQLGFIRPATVRMIIKKAQEYLPQGVSV